MATTVNMKDRYESYKADSYNIWLERFTWNGLHNDSPQNKVSIVNFEKQTHAFKNMQVMSNAKSFYKEISKIATKYVEWACTKSVYNDMEKQDLRNFFIGAIGEYFFTILLQDVNCMLIPNQITNKVERYDFDNVCPRLRKENDYGIDLTGMVSIANTYYSCAIQVKFWNPETDTLITNTIASGAFTDALLNNFIDVEQGKNVVVCWLGDTRHVSHYLTDNRKLYKHILFIDKNVLDNSVNDKMPQFWSNLHIKLQNIQVFK